VSEDTSKHLWNSAFNSVSEDTSKHLWNSAFRVEIANDLLVHGLNERSRIRGQELYSHEVKLQQHVVLQAWRVSWSNAQYEEGPNTTLNHSLKYSLVTQALLFDLHITDNRIFCTLCFLKALGFSEQ
jgi:hypothetical protein